jgi:hypothetical protein
LHKDPVSRGDAEAAEKRNKYTGKQGSYLGKLRGISPHTGSDLLKKKSPSPGKKPLYRALKSFVTLPDQ